MNEQLSVLMINFFRICRRKGHIEATINELFYPWILVSRCSRDGRVIQGGLFIDTRYLLNQAYPQTCGYETDGFGFSGSRSRLQDQRITTKFYTISFTAAYDITFYIHYAYMYIVTIQKPL